MDVDIVFLYLDFLQEGCINVSDKEDHILLKRKSSIMSGNKKLYYYKTYDIIDGCLKATIRWMGAWE